MSSAHIFFCCFKNDYKLNPNNVATELAKMIRRKIGHTYLIITVNNFSDLNFPSVAFTSSAMAFVLITYPTKIHVKNATIGINTLLLTKSIISRIDIPIQLIKLNDPNPREDGIPITNERTATKIPVNLRDQPSLSIKKDTIVSISEMEDVSDAKNTSKKNNAPITVPIFIVANTLGSAMNISPGPAPSAAGSPPENANTDGIIMRPARKAIPVSKISI